MFNFERFRPSMSLKKYFLFSIVFFQCWLSFSQTAETRTFTLAWDDEKPLRLNDKISAILPVVKDNSVDKNNIPTSTHLFNVQNNTIVQDYQIKNVKFSRLGPDQVTGMNISAVPTVIQSEFRTTKARNQNVAVLQLVPVVNQNGNILKINSFTLEYSLENDSNTSSKNNQVKTYAARSVLADGSWFKFRIDTSGIFKIDRQLLRDIGLDPSGIDPRNIRIYGNGGSMLPQLNSDPRYDDLSENAIHVEGEADGSFDDEDYILFYGQGPDHWVIDTQQPEMSRHQTNIYSDYSYYFITADKGTGKRIGTAPQIDRDPDRKITSFQNYYFHELENVNLFANGQQWLGEDFSFQETQDFNLPLSDLVTNAPLIIRARGVAISSSNTRMNFMVNGQQLIDLNFSQVANNDLTRASSDEKVQSFVPASENLVLQIAYNNSGNPSSRAFLDYFEVISTQELTASGKQFSFQSNEANDMAQIYEYTVRNSSETGKIWDISDPLDPKEIQNSGSGADFVFRAAGGTKKYIAHGIADYFLPEPLENNRVTNQNLHGLKDVVYAIICPATLKSEAERLAEHHRTFSGFEVAVVDLEHIYNEFGSGSPDLTAIRDFIRFLYLNATSNPKRIRYVCLFGDASFDFKDRINGNNNMVPAFQSYESFNLATAYVTDDYFGMMDDSEGNLDNGDMQDVATGRFPVSTLQEAGDMVDKTLNYYASSSLGNWRNTLTFVADDPDNSGEFVLQEALDQITQEIEQAAPSFNIRKIYADAHQQETSAGGELYPTVNQAIDNTVETGTLVLDYFGHGGVNGWAEERILEVPQIQAWNNFNTLPLFVTVTCEFARFDNPIRPTAGEYTLWNSNGGTSHLISTTREIFISTGEAFNRVLMNNLLLDNSGYSISEALMHSKNQSFTSQRFFVYSFGDPAMRLARAAPDIRLTKINDILLDQGRDTLKALSRVKLEGVITDDNNQILTDFNGTLNATIFDKPLDKTTLDNDNLGKKMEFKAIESKIFSGRASVSDGVFSFDFIVPKDIRIAYGNAKISMYAENEASDRTGADLSVIIGGIDSNAPEDEEGPDIRLFMNDESFVDGGNTNSSPVLYAILEDTSGINTSITAVDHDIIAILDDDNNNPYVLNDYYETELNDFQKGKVKFPFRGLEPGLHTIKFKCWDTYNNPSESTLTFIVVNDNDLILSNVLNYPNPFINYTEFWFNHNKPNETLEVQVQIFTVSGKLIKTLHRSVQSDGLLSRDISWNGLDDFGNKIGKGVYVYKLHVRSQISNAQAEKFEKLVILQ